VGELRRGDQPGEILALCQLVEEHGRAVEADLAHHYQVRLSDLGTRHLTWRRLDVLIEHLPATSSLRLSTVGPQASWDTSDYLLALIADLLAAGNWQRSGKGQKPRPLPRPGKNTDRRFGSGAVSIAEMRRILDDWHETEVTDGS
jgi:hypothetical protein